MSVPLAILVNANNVNPYQNIRTRQTANILSIWTHIFPWCYVAEAWVLSRWSLAAI